MPVTFVFDRGVLKVTVTLSASPPSSYFRAMARLRQKTNLQDLCNDVLVEIIEQIYQNNYYDLLQLCRVSRRIYLLTTPWIYRRVTIDFARPGDYELLQRLLRDGSKVPSKIRRLEIKSIERATRDQAIAALKLVSRLTNLEKFVWDGFLDIPSEFVNQLKVYPRLRLVIKATQVGRDGLPPMLARAPRTIFYSPVAKKLTSFTYVPSTSAQMYPTFKRDLIRMLAHIDSMKKLDIDDQRTQPGQLWYPEILEVFRRYEFPRLQEIKIWTPLNLFTKDELTLWGEKGGWQNLKSLTLYTASNLVGFAGQAPNLEFLSLSPAFPGREMDEVEEHLDTLKEQDVAAPLGVVKELRYKTYGQLNTQGIRPYVVPFCIIKHISTTLSTLNLCHLHFTARSQEMDVPTADDIHALRTLCPNITNLSVDVHVGSHWPHYLLSELALFPASLLYLALHQPSDLDPPALVKEKACRRAFEHMAQVRKLRAIPPSPQFQVYFKAVVPWTSMQHHYDEADYIFWQTAPRGKTRRRDNIWWRYEPSSAKAAAMLHPPEDLSGSATVELWLAKRELRAAHWKWLATCGRRGRWMEEERTRARAVKGELRRRGRFALAGKRFGREVTLFDEWD